MTAAAARIDWGQGRLVGYAVPGADGPAHAIVEVCLDGQPVHQIVADQPLMPLRSLLGDLPWPPREDAAFTLRLPAARLLPGMLQADSLVLSLRCAGEAPFFEASLAGPGELMRLSDALPQDQWHRVRFDGLADGAVLRGEVINRHGPGVPALHMRVNGGAPAPLALLSSTPDGLGHAFEIPLASAGLIEGENLVQVLTADGQPLATYPLHIGPASVGQTEQRLAALEAQMAFLKHVLLAQGSGQAALDQLKTDLVRLCTDMLALQRANLEREWAALRRRG